MTTTALKFTATKKGWRTRIVVERNAPHPVTGETTQEALVDLVRNHLFSHLPVKGHYAWTATSRWENTTRRGHGPTREAAVADLHAE